MPITVLTKSRSSNWDREGTTVLISWRESGAIMGYAILTFVVGEQVLIHEIGAYYSDDKNAVLSLTREAEVMIDVAKTDITFVTQGKMGPVHLVQVKGRKGWYVSNPKPLREYLTSADPVADLRSRKGKSIT